MVPRPITANGLSESVMDDPSSSIRSLDDERRPGRVGGREARAGARELRTTDRESGSADRDDRRPPGATGCGDVDALADLRAHQRAAERRVGRDAAHARDLDLHLLALLVLDLDDRA